MQYIIFVRQITIWFDLQKVFAYQTLLQFMLIPILIDRLIEERPSMFVVVLGQSAVLHNE